MFHDMRLGTKLILGFSVVALIALALGTAGYYGAVRGVDAVEEIGRVRLPSVESLLVIQGKAEGIRGTLRTLAIPGLPGDVRERQYRNMADAGQQCEAAWKVYEPLHQTPEEEQVWKQFVPAWEAFRTESDKFLETARQIDKLGMSNPMELGRKVESLTKDHYRLAQRVLVLMSANQMFDGGEDHTACNAGKWMATFKSDNPALAAEVQAMHDPHHRFHGAVVKIKEAHKQGNPTEMQTLYTREMVPAMEKVFHHFEAMIRIIEEGVSLFEQGQVQLLGSTTQAQRTAIGLLGKLVEINQTEAARKVKTAHIEAGFLKTVSAIAAIAGALLSIALGILITRGITRPLNRVIEGLSEGAEQVAAASGQVSSSSQQMAEGSSEQAASIEETSSSLEEMSSMTKQNADNARQADGLMAEAKQVVSKADESMSRLTVSMDEISRASEETSKIVKTIDEIAFQTNLLALNAAVEAARAGDAGAGFAVVADEVRNLALRAAEAAKNTSSLIEGTVKKVKEGSGIVSMTNDAFRQVSKSAAKVAELVAEIAAASGEQAQGIEQVNKAVSEMDKVVQQNAANAEENASASEELSAQAGQMKAYVAELSAVVEGRNGRRGQIETGYANAAVYDRAGYQALPAPKRTGAGREMAFAPRREKSFGDYRSARGSEEVIPREGDFKDF